MEQAEQRGNPERCIFWIFRIESLIIVVGMERTGTSLMMQTLHYLGLHVYGAKFPRNRIKENNPNGYFEDDMTLKGDFSALINDDTTAVKVDLRKFIEKRPDAPTDKIILCQREPLAAANSRKLFDRKPVLVNVDRVIGQHNRYYGLATALLRQNMMTVNYEVMIANPNTEINRIKAFVGATGDIAAAVSNVRSV